MTGIKYSLVRTPNISKKYIDIKNKLIKNYTCAESVNLLEINEKIVDLIFYVI